MSRFGGFGRGGGGWRGAIGSTGGLTRTYGLQWHFMRGGPEGPMPRITRASLRRIGHYFRPYWKRWLVIISCIVVTASLNVLPPFCVAMIIDRAIPSADYGLVGMLAASIVGLAMLSGLIGVLQQTLTAAAGQGIMFDLRNELYVRLQRMGLHFYTATRSGEIVSRISNDVNAIQGVATGTIVAIASNIAGLTAASVALFTKSWQLGLLAISVVPAFYLPSKVVGGIRRRLAMATQEAQASLLAFMTERLHVGGALLTKVFGQREADAADFRQRSGAVRDLSVKGTVVGRWLFMILMVFSATGPALIYWYGGGMVIREQLTVGTLVAFAALLTMLYRPLMQLANVYVDVQGAVAVFERIFEYVDLVPDVRDKADVLHLRAVRGHVAFEHVTFSYPISPSGLAGNGAAAPAEVQEAGEPAEEKERFSLVDVTFDIAPGQRVALVGPSGAGKTTVTYLVPRFYDPLEGRVTLDGFDLRDLEQESLRGHIGMVTQETFLFHDSIRVNLLYARPGATQRELEDACRAANIHDFIAALPEGYDTVVGERGFRLSGGEKQRVSIARAILKDPTILILDEATSSLDATSEHLIQMALEKLLRGRTSLIIAHRLSTILNADKIVVMEAGRVVDMGRHSQLLARQGLYAQLFHQQFAKVLESNGGTPRGGA